MGVRALVMRYANKGRGWGVVPFYRVRFTALCLQAWMSPEVAAR